MIRARTTGRGWPSSGGVPAWDGTPTSNKMAELGHSFIANGQYQTDGYRSYGVATGAADESGQVVRRLGAAGAFGVGGDDTNQIDVRFDSALAACFGGTLYVWNGINDGLLTVDQTLSKMLTWKQKAIASRTNIVFHTVSPCGNDAFPANRPTTAVAADMKARNARMLAELPGTGSYVVDCFAQLLKVGTDFDLLEKWSPQDGKHPGNLYVQEITAPADAIVLKQIYPSGPMDLPDASDVGAVNTNVSLLTGLTTTYSTTPPTGYSNAKATGTTGTVIEYRQVTKNGVDWCEIRISGTIATANAAVDVLRQISLQGGLVTGKTYEGWIEYDFDPGTVGILSVQLGMQEAGSSTLLNWDNNRYATQPMSALARTGRQRTPPFTSVDGLTDHRFRLSAYLGTDVAPTAVFRVRIMKNREVQAS